jgi:hypothetical protein
MLLDQTIDGFAVGGQGTECRLLVYSHEAAVAEHVGAGYRCELTLHRTPPSRIFLPVAYRCQR